MKKTLANISKIVIFLGLGIWITYHMLTALTPDQRTALLMAIQHINFWFLLPIFFVGLLSHFFRALRWRYLLASIDLRPSVTNTMLAVMVGYLVNLAVPRAGEVAKCTVLARYEKMPASKMLGTIVAERAFDLCCLLAIAVVTFFIEMKRINHFVAEGMEGLAAKLQKDHSKVTIIAVTAAVLVSIGILLYRKLRKSKLGKIMEEMAQGILSIFRMKEKWAFLGYTLLIWLMYTLQIYLGLLCVPGTALLPIMAALVVLVYGSVGIIATPGGIGAYPYLVAQILTAYPVDSISGAAFGWIAWAAQTLIILIIGTLALFILQPYNNWKDAKARLDKE